MGADEDPGGGGSGQQGHQSSGEVEEEKMKKTVFAEVLLRAVHNDRGSYSHFTNETGRIWELAWQAHFLVKATKALNLSLSNSNVFDQGIA